MHAGYSLAVLCSIIGSLRPVAFLPGFAKPAVCASFSPVKYQMTGHSAFYLPYKMIFAIATQDSVLVYDTQHVKPFALVANVHYATITDLAWRGDGLGLIVSSTDGFCTVIEFQAEEFGLVFDEPVQESQPIPDVTVKSTEEVSTEQLPVIIEGEILAVSDEASPTIIDEEMRPLAYKPAPVDPAMTVTPTLVPDANSQNADISQNDDCVILTDCPEIVHISADQTEQKPVVAMEAIESTAAPTDTVNLADADIQSSISDSDLQSQSKENKTPNPVIPVTIGKVLKTPSQDANTSNFNNAASTKKRITPIFLG